MVVFLTIMTVSCGQVEDPTEISMSDYEMFGASVKDSFERLTNLMRENNTYFIEIEEVKSLANGVFPGNDEFRTSFIRSYEAQNILAKGIGTSNSSYGDNSESRNDSDVLTSTQRSFVSEILNGIWGLKSESDLGPYLRNKFNEVFEDNDLSSEDRDYMLIYIVSYESFMEVISENMDLLGSSSDGFGANLQGGIELGEAGWFSDMWKCVAGTAGSALSGAVMGCGALWGLGAKIGALGGPGGAVSGALTGCGAGALIGGIAGGLVGAATFCGEDD